MPENAASAAAPPAGAQGTQAFKRGLLSLNFKFSFATGLLLFALLYVVTLVINDQLRADLTREVAERAKTVARNIAAKVPELHYASDTLTIAVLLKDLVEDPGKAAPPAEQSPIAGALADLKAGLSGHEDIKNEGITRIIAVLKAKDNAGAETYYDSLHVDTQEKPADLPQSRAAATDEPFPVFEKDGRLYYDITEPAVIGGTGKEAGLVHLYLRRDVISDAVRVATTRLVAVMLMSLAVGLIVLWVVVRLLMRPIGQLVTGVNAVASGNFGVRLNIKRGDELGDLVDAYNGMAKSLAEKEAVQEALAKYTSKDLVSQMLSDSAQLDLGGRRVHATIFFSVVRGMHALSQTLPAEEYVALINEYLEVETDVVMRNGGSIDKFIGDEVMAVWLIPLDSPAEKKKETAVQAVRAAVETQEAIEKLNADRVKRGEQPFLVSIGVNNGEVVSGNMGSSVKMDYTVLGGNVNLSARLGLVAAQGGQTIISERVYDFVSDKFKIDKLAPMQLKGIKEPVPLFWPRKALK